MKSIAITGLGVGLIFIVVAIVMLPTGITDVHSADFELYYGTAGETAQEKIASDPAYQELLSLSVFEDVDLSISHAESKHADDKEVYDECMNSGETLLAFENPANKHCIEIMATVIEESGNLVERFIVRVVKKVNGKFYEITAFTEEWESLAEVERYMFDGGYMQIWP